MEITLDDLVIPKYDDVLYDILEHKYTHYVFYSGRGSTKSTFISIAVILLMIEEKNKNVHAVIFRKVSNTLRDSVYANICFAVSLLGLDAAFKKTVSPMEITYLKTGQKILFRGLDAPEKIKSIKAPFGYFGITFFEELDQYHGREEIRNVLQSTMRGKDGVFWNFESLNPPVSQANWANKDILIDRPERLVVKSSYLDVPREWLSDQFFQEAEFLKQTNERAYRHEYLGEVTGTGGAVFENVTERVITDEEYRRFDKLFFGVDFGFAVDPFVWCKLYYDKTRQILYILDEIYEIKLSNKAAAEKIKRKHSGSMMITADSEEPKSIAEMRDLGLNITGARKGADSVDYGIKFLQSLSQIVIDKRRTPNAYKEFVSYEYERNKNGEYVSAYPDKNNHFVDSVRYALENEMRNSRIYTSNQRIIY